MTSKISRHIRIQKAYQALFLLLVIFAVGCSRRYSDVPAYSPFMMKDYDNKSVGRFKSSFLAEQIDEYFRGSAVGPIGVTTFVNLDDLYSTSTFGRVYSEQLMSELAMRGFDVVEMRHADALQFLSSEGEFALSRDVSALRPARDLSGVIVGTYVASPVRVYVNARLVDPANSLVLSAASVEMEKTKEIARLLRGNAFPTTLERIPVRHLGYSAQPLLSDYRRQWQLEEMGPYPPAPPVYGNNPSTPTIVSPPRLPALPAEKGPAHKGAK